MSSIPVEHPRQRQIFPSPLLKGSFGRFSSPSTLRPIARNTLTQNQAKKVTKVGDKVGMSRMDIAIFIVYFTNMFVVNLSVVTVPALAEANLINPVASAAFESGVASMAPMGGAIGKVINGFVCQRLGGRRASWIYLVGLAVLSCGMSFTQSVRSIGSILMLYEFLSSIQWTSICLVMDDKHKNSPRRIARGVGILSLSSYTGALAAKTVGAALLNISGCWRSVTRIGSLVALIGASTMYFGIAPPEQRRKLDAAESSSVDKPPGVAKVPQRNPASVLSSIVTSKLFWMIGIGHSLGYVIRGSDRLLVPFLHQATGFPRHTCASLTSFVTLGLVLGLRKGTVFSAMESVPDKMTMLKRNYVRAIISFLGLSACALNVVHGWIDAPYIMTGVISTLSCLAASSISFQLSQVPMLVASNMFDENKAVALSLVDAGGFFFTSHVFAANSMILRTFGWPVSWTFLAMFLAAGAALMLKYMPEVLLREQKRVAAFEP
jgi:MFS family permease